MSHHHGKTAGQVCSKFCTQIRLGPEMDFLNFFLLIFFCCLKMVFLNMFFFWSGGSLGWDWVVRGGEDEGEGRVAEGRGCKTFS